MTLLPLAVLLLATADAPPPRVLTTPDGIRFGIQGEKPSRPAPTLLVFATTLEQTLTKPQYHRAGTLLHDSHGFLVVSVDLPCHGAERRPGEPPELKGWSFRLRNGDNFVPQFLAKVRALFDYLIAERYTDPARIAIAGTSRGGFMALQAAAADPRIRWVMAFSPVTDLLALNEFAGMDSNAVTRSLALVHAAPRLTDRAIWMCIGNTDDRVGTHKAIAFYNRFIESARAEGRFPDITFELQPTVNHHHLEDSHDRAAAWLEQRLNGTPPR